MATILSSIKQASTLPRCRKVPCIRTTTLIARNGFLLDNSDAVAMQGERSTHPLADLVRMENAAIVAALQALRAALPRPGSGRAPPGIRPLRRALLAAGTRIREEANLPGRRLLIEALLRKVAFPGRVGFRIGESRADRERVQELAHAFVVAEALEGAAWDDFALAATLLVELHLARAGYIESQLLEMASLRLDETDWQELDREASVHLAKRPAVSTKRRRRGADVGRRSNADDTVAV